MIAWAACVYNRKRQCEIVNSWWENEKLRLGGKHKRVERQQILEKEKNEHLGILLTNS